MPILSQSSSNWVLSLKVVFLSTGVLCSALMLKLSVPVVTEFASSELPSIWSLVVSWLRPPYLYVVINCIIITIVASTKLQQKVVDESPPETVVYPVPVKVSADYAVAYGGDDVKNASVEVRPEFAYGYDANVMKGSEFDVDEHVDDRLPEVETKTTTLAIRAAEEMRGEDELALSRSLWTPQLSSSEYSLSSNEKPTVSVRIRHRKAVKSSPEGGRTLGVSKPKRQETLESTWKTITEGRSMPLTRHLRKSDTWETHGRVDHLQDHDQRMTKSETFKHPTTTANSAPKSSSPVPGRLRREPSGSGNLRKEPSLSQDDLNRRVEAFIKKFNEDMRLQRQESLNQYMEMINRGVHQKT